MGTCDRGSLWSKVRSLKDDYKVTALHSSRDVLQLLRSSSLAKEKNWMSFFSGELETLSDCQISTEHDVLRLGTEVHAFNPNRAGEEARCLLSSKPAWLT